MTLVRHPQEALFALEDFIAEAFTEQEFARILRMVLDDDTFLPKQASPREIASVGVRELARHGCIDQNFFLHLRTVRRKRIREILFIENQFRQLHTSRTSDEPQNPLNARNFTLSIILIFSGVFIISLGIVQSHSSVSIVAICACIAAYLFGLAAGDRPGQLLAALIRWRLRAPEQPIPVEEGSIDAETVSVEVNSGGEGP